MRISKLNNLLLKIIFASIFLITCKESKDFNKEPKEKNSTELISENKDDNKNSSVHIEDLQGIWRSFSLYLEHESEFKDYNEIEYYQVIYGKKILLIKIGQSLENGFSISEGFIGFSNSEKEKFENKESLKNRLKNSGEILTRYISDSNEYNSENIEYSENYERYFEVSEVYEDGFNYDKNSQKISFRKLSSLPVRVFKKIKELEIKKEENLIKKYGLKELCSKVNVIVDKTFFHDEMSENTKRKAFLLKGDKAYVEETYEDWTKI